MSDEISEFLVELPEYSKEDLKALVEEVDDESAGKVSSVSNDNLLSNPAPYTASEDESGSVKKDFKTENLDVVVTSKKHPANPLFRDADVVVNQGPATVGLEMQDANGTKLSGQKLIIEYNSNGEALKTLPNLDIVEFDKNTPPIAYIEYVGEDGVRIILPMNGDKIKALQAQIQKANIQFQTLQNEGKSLIIDPDLLRIAALSPSEKTLGDIRKEYLSLITKHIDLLVSKQDTKATSQKLEEYKKAHTSPPLEPEKIKQNQLILEQARVQTQEKFKQLATREFIRAIQNEISFGAADNRAGINAAIAGEERAKTKLQALGVKIPEIELIEKVTITHNISQAVKAESVERQEGINTSKSAVRRRSSLLVGARMGIPQDVMDASIYETKIKPKHEANASMEVSSSSGSGLAAPSTPIAAQKAAERINEERSKSQVMQRSLGSS